MSEKDGWKPVSDPSIPPAAGAYSRAATAGGFIFLSGQVPRDLMTGALVGATVREQTVKVFENIETLLRGAGASLDSIVSVTAYLADIETWGEFDAAYRECLKPPYPTRTTVGAGLHGFLVEISVIAAPAASR